ncbi:hypothetical protein HPB51_023144 [Rhipicephalus microplus]|uniref:Uncharacterized protein n=1 Tax=Rhipicephalus microplus TaxID=6941 RepID=A0A9J6DJK6_RHIMP|nr:hypothetical protein HPB51_023144 [Rhipicephalus microplus]
MSCEDLYAILVPQVVSRTGSTCILTCWYTSDNIRKWKGVERCPHNAGSYGKAKAAVDLQAMDLPDAGGITKGDAQHRKLSQHLLSPHRCVRGVNQVVFQVNHEDRYDIAWVHVVPNTRRTTTLAFHFVGDSMLKRNPKETCHYPTVSSGVTQGVSVPEGDGSSENSLLTNGCRICVGLSLAVSIEDPLAARSKIRFDLGRQRATYRNISDITSVGNKRRVRSCNHDRGVRLPRTLPRTITCRTRYPLPCVLQVLVAVRIHQMHGAVPSGLLFRQHRNVDTAGGSRTHALVKPLKLSGVTFHVLSSRGG